MKQQPFFFIFILCFLAPSLSLAKINVQQKNKLLEMFKFFYLPFDLGFEVGESADEIIPVTFGQNKLEKSVFDLEKMRKLEKQWSEIRNLWKTQSVFNDTSVTLNGSATISPHFVVHRLSANRGALDTLSIKQRMLLKDLLKGKPKDVQASVLQKQFLRTFISPDTTSLLHFFIVAPNWCASSENYRTLIEIYTKKFAMSRFTLHSIIIEDPNEQIFDSKAMNDLFPFSKKYSHESVPRFLLTEANGIDFNVQEEENALHLLYEKYFSSHRGFLRSELSLENKK